MVSLKLGELIVETNQTTAISLPHEDLWRSAEGHRTHYIIKEVSTRGSDAGRVPCSPCCTTQGVISAACHPEHYLPLYQTQSGVISGLQSGAMMIMSFSDLRRTSWSHHHNAHAFFHALVTASEIPSWSLSLWDSSSGSRRQYVHYGGDVTTFRLRL